MILNSILYIHKSLCYIEYANLKEQSERISDPILLQRCILLQEKLMNYIQNMSTMTTI
jgi:hypothetical protein